ncbi:helix-turn-helix transcriptional regulator [Brevibacillus fortis]|uniref:DNA-binding transcriptional regulator n=1 Tax=Brevibacillus fortis TaxID=2126352 RepID=A0A2P7UKH5_9BACL|nr:WYL domain-containing protein [Brevibacillus fortis]PSJ87496.1 DNA-binding transcriptional regulator [Brevibacillus fortis]
MSKADNMLSILWLLKTGKRMTAKQLAEILEINIRTVYRYIDSLCASGVPIISDAGHNGGYSLLQHFNEAPLFFDLHEQKALIHAAAFAQEAGYPFGADLHRAISKLKRYTNEEQRDAIDRHSIGFEVIQPPVDPSLESTLQELELSVANGHTLSMEYQKAYQTTRQKRHIDPYGLVYWKGKWYIVAYCHLRSTIRSFRVDRVHEIQRTEASFQRPPEFSARHFFLSNLLPETDKQGNTILLKVKGRPQALADLCGHWYLGHTVIERSEAQVIFHVDEQMAHSILPHYLLPFGKSIQIEEPAFVKERLAAIAADLFHFYQST